VARGSEILAILTLGQLLRFFFFKHTNYLKEIMLICNIISCKLISLEYIKLYVINQVQLKAKSESDSKVLFRTHNDNTKFSNCVHAWNP
jgi:hypothetical protein